MLAKCFFDMHAPEQSVGDVGFGRKSDEMIGCVPSPGVCECAGRHDAITFRSGVIQRVNADIAHRGQSLSAIDPVAYNVGPVTGRRQANAEPDYFGVPHKLKFSIRSRIGQRINGVGSQLCC